MSSSGLINSINAAADSITPFKEDERLALFAACERLKSKLENPRDAAFRIMLAPHQSIALRLAIDMKVFDAAAALSANKSEIHTEDLATQTGADPLLVARIMRFLVGMGLFNEVGQGTFTSTPIASAYVTASPMAQGVIHMTTANEIVSALPSYFSKNGYQSPGDAYNGPFQYARNTNLHCFDWIATQPKLQHAFNVVMGMTRPGRSNRWFEVFPASSKLHANSPSDVLIVDIGGGVGHDLISFKEKYPDLPGLLILQEISVVVDSIANLPAGIQAMKHDFFDPQPIKGAKSYYLANVLHDWPDKQALKILGNTREAMDAESILLLNENMLPETNVPLRSASADLMMMAGFSSLERTERQFKTLLEEAGLELRAVWTPEGSVEGEGTRLMEAGLKSGHANA